MKIPFRITGDQGDPIESKHISQIGYTKEQADQANQAFDGAVRQYLRDWIEQGTLPAKSADFESDTEDFIEHGALRSFFKHRDDAFALLLENDAIARHMLRPINEVYFENDAYEPMLAKFEKRIYNLAAHRENFEVPFRYSPASRQGAHGDTVPLLEMNTGQIKEDIGMYFGTRRSDATALTILADQLRREALSPTLLPIHVVTDGYMEDSLRVVKTTTEQLQADGDEQLHCFVIQRRHAADDRHLGAALLIMNSQQPNKPQRVIFCDTLNPSGRPPWWDKFKAKLDAVFPQPEGEEPASDILEDGGVRLQRLHDDVPVRHQDIDCAFYTFSIVRALIQVAKADPILVLTGSIDELVSQMTERMPEYFEKPNQPKEPEIVREQNIIRRWRTGWNALINIMRSKATDLLTQESAVVDMEMAFSL
ncbi:hypothetical protein HNV11_15445 [Spirosoma taeanense]|uniref:Uncharacterized protein n=1 Tax=Spirosoma taeanense TaxID=2735870 RepID=A0A6M5YBH3_9BACT|nr:hypothetical protein [Spirosoma taeanense]QJW90676.1 hypothetical protein HNV11_15445 [Spirosoma taeanense]